MSEIKWNAHGGNAVGSQPFCAEVTGRTKMETAGGKFGIKLLDAGLYHRTLDANF
jgi:hypothetical protein